MRFLYKLLFSEPEKAENYPNITYEQVAKRARSLLAEHHNDHNNANYNDALYQFYFYLFNLLKGQAGEGWYSNYITTDWPIVIMNNQLLLIIHVFLNNLPLTYRIHRTSKCTQKKRYQYHPKLHLANIRKTRFCLINKEIIRQYESAEKKP